MKMLEINALQNGAHQNQTYHGRLPEGWAIVPEGMQLQNFPFGKAVVKEVDGRMTVVEWTPGVVPQLGTTALTPAQQREEAYNTRHIIEWEGELLTVTQAAQKWQYYAAEGSAKADELQALIAAAKQTIREQYPDEEVAT